MGPVLTAFEAGRLRWDYSRTCVFGVVNVTPDSFYDGGRFADPARAVEHGLALAAQGADVLDVGGESTRPGSTPVSAEEELGRVLPVIEALVQRTATAISIDTYKARVARAAVAAGASVINDVSGLLLDAEMAEAAAESEALVVLGHLRGQPATMLEEVRFADVVAEVADELRDSVRRAVRAGVRADRIWIDPGIGFGKTAEQSLALLRAVGRLRDDVGYPVLVGPSRKSFIGSVTGQPAGERLMGTCAAVAAVVVAGADAVRVHDVGELAPAVRVADAIRDRRPPARPAPARR
jgi:dihydropteroate synthase